MFMVRNRFWFGSTESDSILGLTELPTVTSSSQLRVLLNIKVTFR